MRIRPIIGLLLILAVFSYNQVYADLLGDPTAIPSPYVFRVDASNCKHNPKMRRQTGFRVVGVPGIVTALHGIIDCEDIRVYDSFNIEFQLNIMKVSLERDIALLGPEPLDWPQGGFEEGVTLPSKNDDRSVFVIGYPLGVKGQAKDENLRLRENIIIPLNKRLSSDSNVTNNIELSNRRSPNINLDILDVEGILSPGHSGAPVFNNEGEVIGVVNGGVRGSTIVWASVWKDVKASLKDIDDVQLAFDKLKETDPSPVLSFLKSSVNDAELRIKFWHPLSSEPELSIRLSSIEEGIFLLESKNIPSRMTNVSIEYAVK